MIVVIGGSSVIGRELVRRLAQRAGEVVIFTYHTKEEEAKRLARDLQEEGKLAFCQHLDGRDEQGVQSFFEGIKPYGQLKAVIHVMGKSHYGLLQEMTYLQWQELLITNLSSAFLVAKEAIKLMLPQKKGHLIFFSSIWGEAGASHEVAYSASKGGLNAMVKALAKELAPSHILVNAISPGPVDTPMLDALGEDKAEVMEAMALGRLVEPSDLAHLVAYLVDAEMITGQIITMDGGYLR